MHFFFFFASAFSTWDERRWYHSWHNRCLVFLIEIPINWGIWRLFITWTSDSVCKLRWRWGEKRTVVTSESEYIATFESHVSNSELSKISVRVQSQFIFCGSWFSLLRKWGVDRRKRVKNPSELVHISFGYWIFFNLGGSTTFYTLAIPFPTISSLQIRL